MPDFLTILFCFQLGWVPVGELVYYQPDETVFTGSAANSFDATFKIDIEAFDFIVFGGSMINYFSFNDLSSDRIRFSPMGMTFSVYAGIKVSENISIKALHSCTHPIAEQLNLGHGKNSLDSGYDRIYLEITGKI